MPNKTAQTFILMVAVLGLLLAPCCAYATDIDFETIADQVAVGNSYAADGVIFNNALSLTAGFSLNEFDYPPHSGVRAVGDSGGPMEMVFTNPITAFSGWFTWAAPIELDIYLDNNFTLFLGSIITTSDNLGFSQQVGLIDLAGTFQSIRILELDPSSQGMIMDDLSFTPAETPVPEPSTLVLLGTACAAALSRLRRSTGRRTT